jgi:hypothetical protein
MLLHCAILYVVVDVITSIICTTYTYKVLHKFFAKVPGLCFNEADQLQGRVVPGSKLQLLVSHQFALAYFV